MASGSQNNTTYQTQKWTNLRAFTIGDTAKNVDGTAAVSWSKDEILGASTDAYFLRGDKVWSNALSANFSAGTYILAGTYLQARNHIYMDAGSLQMKYNNEWYEVVKNHNNGNITVNAASAILYLGYQTTTSLNFMNGKATMNNSGHLTAPKFIGDLQGNADTATALTSNAGDGEQPIYFTGGKPHATSYALKATVNAASVKNTFAYYSDTHEISSYSRIRNIGSARYPIDIYVYNDAGNLISEIWYDAGNATNVTRGQWNFLSESPNSTNNTGTTGKYEYFYLPNVDTGRTTNAGYAIRTSKDNNYTVSKATTAESCTGNAATATKATQDGSGNTITSYYVTLSTDQTITGTKTFQKRIIAYGYKQATNLPFMTFDKPGSYATGIGPDGTNNRIHFGPCDLAGTAWTSTSAFNSNEWHFQGKITATSTVTATGFTGPLTGNVTGNCSGSSGSCTGNAATATTLKTARNLWGNSFNGSAAVDGSINLGDEKTVIGKITRKKSGGGGWAYTPFRVIDNAGTDFAHFGVYGGANALTYIFIGANGYDSTANLQIDGSGNLTAPKFTGAVVGNVTGNCSGSSGSCTGNAATATKLHTARAINGTNFDGSGAITTANWGTARNFTIKDYNSNNAGTAVSVNGSGAVTLLMPSTIYCSDVRSGNTRIVSDWIGFYQSANAGGKRYGYIECDVNRMYFRKENSSTQDHYFDFGSPLYVNGAIGCAGAITTASALLTGSGITIRRDPSSGNCKIWFATDKAVNKWRIGVDANDRFAISAYADGEGSYDFWVYNNGACYYKTSIGASSRYIKHNIHLLTMDTGNIIDRMEPVSFVFNNDQKETINLGFIYEDLVEILPEVCFHGEGEDNNLGINYTGIIPVLVKEIQSLRKRVATVETELNSYKSKT